MEEHDEKTADLPPPLRMPGFNPVDAAHTLIEAAEDVRWEFVDKAAFLKRVKHIEFGLSAEDEFSALITWLGSCQLVHRNGQDWQSSCDATKWNIPDLFAVFRKSDLSFSTMIEVKTTSDGPLRFTEAYVRGLREYSALHSQPLLVAWRPREFGVWMLFDPDHLQSDAGKLVIDFETAFKNNLLGCVAGDFFISRLEGSGLYFRLRRDSEKVPKESGYSAVFVYEDIGWRDAQGRTHKRLPRAVKYMLLSNSDFLDSVEDDYITKAIVARGGLLQAQDVFRTLVTGWLRENEPMRWKHVRENRDVLLPRDELLEGLQAYFGTFLHYVIHHLPNSWPTCLPKAWKSLARRA